MSRCRVSSCFFLIFLGLIFLGAGLFCPTSAALVVFPDPHYQVLEAGPYKIIFPSPRLPQARTLQSWQLQLNKIYATEFAWKLDKKVPIIMAGPRNQISNAFVALSPQMWSVFYPGGGYLLDRMATPSWLFVLAIHETAHIYQLNAKKSPISRWMQTLLRNPYPGTHPQHALWWLSMAPNSLLPEWMLEGHAVLNESRFQRGGRLYSGYVRATLLSAIKHKQLTLSRLMNSHLDYHFANKYHWGGYVFQYLLKQWPHIAPGQLFYEHSSQPWHLNAAFKKVYNQSYPKVFKDFIQSWQPLADQHQQAAAPVLQRSFVHAPLHRHAGSNNTGSDDPGPEGDKILFLSSTARSRPTLNIYNTKTEQWSRQIINLPMGKVFVTDSSAQYQVSASVLTGSRDRKFTLVGPGFKANTKFNNKIVYDRRAGFTAYIKVNESFDEPQLYVNDKHIGTAHSSALLNNRGDVYYFKQHDQQRTLYNNNVALLKFKGFYAFPVDIGPRGEVYFIANTPYGSGLYAYQPMRGGRIVRQHISDAIVDAKRLGPQKFLVVEVGASSYEYKIITTQTSAQQPAVYKGPKPYHWPDSGGPDSRGHNSSGHDSSLRAENPASPHTTKPPSHQTTTNQHEQPPAYYKAWPLTALRSVAPVVEYRGGRAWHLQLPLRWADPLSYHKILTQFEFVNTGVRIASSSTPQQQQQHETSSQKEADALQTTQIYSLHMQYDALRYRLQPQVFFKSLHLQKRGPSLAPTNNSEARPTRTTQLRSHWHHPWQVGLGLRYPLYQTSLLGVDAATLFRYTHPRLYAVDSQLHMLYNLRYPLGWSSHRKYEGLLYHKWQPVEIGHPTESITESTAQLNSAAEQTRRAERSHQAEQAAQAAQPHQTEQPRGSQQSAEASTPRYASIWGGYIGTQYEFPFEHIVQLSYQGAVAQGLLTQGAGAAQSNVISVQEASGLWLPNAKPGSEFKSLFAHKAKAYAHLSKLGLKYTKVFNHSLYFVSWPLSLRRWTVTGEAYYSAGYAAAGNAATAQWHQHFEFATGSEFEFLVYHKIPLRLALLYAQQHNNNKKFLMRLSLNM